MTDESFDDLDQPLAYSSSAPKRTQFYEQLQFSARKLNLPLSTEITQDQFQTLKDTVLTYHTAYAEIMKQSGSMSFYEYAKSRNRKNPNPKLAPRIKEFSVVLKNEVERLLGKEAAESAERQILLNQSVSTAQHFAPLSPHAFNPTLEGALQGFTEKDPSCENVIVLACAGVSFDNFWFPRGHFFHTFLNDTLIENQLTFFGRSVDAYPVFYAKGFDKNAIEQAKKRLVTLANERYMTRLHLRILTDLLDQVYLNEKVLKAGSYTDQNTIILADKWQKTFEGMAPFTPRLLFLAQEKIVIDLLLKYHIKEKTALHNLLFDPKWHELIMKHFNGIQGTFNMEHNYGTFLFWGVSKKTGLRVRMWKEGSALVARDGSLSIELSPEAIEKAIRNQDLIPSLLVTFVTLSFYYGLILGGGLAQPLYLTQMKEAYIAMQKELGNTEEVALCEQTPTTDFFPTRPMLTYLETARGERTPASLLDFYLYKKIGNFENILEATKKVTLDEIGNRLLPELYTRFCPPQEQKENIRNISEYDVEKFTGLDKKVPAWSTLIDPVKSGQ